jgi:hypothetical protein
MAYEKLFMHNQSDEKSIKWASPLIYGRPHAIAKRCTDKCLHIDCQNNFSACCDASISLHSTVTVLNLQAGQNVRS